MPIPSFLHFTPVPCRARYDGWLPGLQVRFIVALAQGARPGEAAERLGMSRQSAYKLRRRAGAESFAAAWDSALRVARRIQEAPPSVPPPRFRFAGAADAVAVSGSRQERRMTPRPAGSTRDAFERVLAALEAQSAPQGGEVDKGGKGDTNRM